MTTGERIREARERAGLTQVDLAERAGMSKSQLYQIETDWRGRVPTVATVQRIAAALGEPWHELFSGS